MAYEGNIAPVQVMDSLNSAQFDAKRALRLSQEEIRKIISDLGDPATDIIYIDGVPINKKTELVRLNLAVSNKMEQLSTMSTTIMSVFSELYKMEKALGGQS